MSRRIFFHSNLAIDPGLQGLGGGWDALRGFSSATRWRCASRVDRRPPPPGAGNMMESFSDHPGMGGGIKNYW